MKKLFFILLAVAMTSSCSMLINTATHKKVNVQKPIAAVFADLDVSPTKVVYFSMPSKSVAKGGLDNVINTAVREALMANGDADVFVGLETQVKYAKNGKIESVTISGYPAKYTNFRNAGDAHLRELNLNGASSSSQGLFKLGKK